MALIDHIGTHIIYENPKPHVRSRHGYFPGVIRLASNDLLALFVIGEAFESADTTTHVSRSIDNGGSWGAGRPALRQNTSRRYDQRLHKPTSLRDGRLVAMGYRFERADPGIGG